MSESYENDIFKNIKYTEQLTYKKVEICYMIFSTHEFGVYLENYFYNTHSLLHHLLSNHIFL